MGTKTLYVSEQDEHVWEEIRATGGAGADGPESMSRTVSEALRLLLDFRRPAAADDDADAHQTDADAQLIGRFRRELQTAGLQRAGQAFARSYVRAKRAQGVADFNDLIAWTRRLFEQPGMGEWVRYKLDQRTDHILVDEAQDTNADQWAIVDALAEEFFSGNPEAEDRWRTLFMVGD